MRRRRPVHGSRHRGDHRGREQRGYDREVAVREQAHAVRVRAVVTGGAVLVIRIVLRTGAGILVSVLAVVRRLVDGGGGGRLMVNPTVSGSPDHRLGSGGAVGDQEEQRHAAKEAPSGRMCTRDHNQC